MTFLEITKTHLIGEEIKIYKDDFDIHLAYKPNTLMYVVTVKEIEVLENSEYDLLVTFETRNGTEMKQYFKIVDFTVKPLKK